MPHLLIIEDSALVTSALRLLFEASGYRVTIAQTIASALQQAAADPPEIMLLDLTLPDGHGLDLMTQLREQGILPPTVIALTGDDDDFTRERCLAAGCRAVLGKPVPTQQLLAQVRSLQTAPQ